MDRVNLFLQELIVKLQHQRRTKHAGTRGRSPFPQSCAVTRPAPGGGSPAGRWAAGGGQGACGRARCSAARCVPPAAAGSHWMGWASGSPGGLGRLLVPRPPRVAPLRSAAPCRSPSGPPCCWRCWRRTARRVSTEPDREPGAGCGISMGSGGGGRPGAGLRRYRARPLISASALLPPAVWPSRAAARPGGCPVPAAEAAASLPDLRRD